MTPTPGTPMPLLHCYPNVLCAVLAVLGAIGLLALSIYALVLWALASAVVGDGPTGAPADWGHS